MFDTILDNLNTIQNEMVAMFKQQYEWGWFGDKVTANATLRSYVRSNALTAAGYKEITGEDYVEETNS